MASACMLPEAQKSQRQKFQSLKKSVQFSNNRRRCFYAEIENIPQEITNAAVQKLCSEYGNIANVRGPNNYQTSAKTRKILVGFWSSMSAFAAQEALNNYDIGKDAALGRVHLLRVHHNPHRYYFHVEEKRDSRLKNGDSVPEKELEELCRVNVENSSLYGVVVKTMTRLGLKTEDHDERAGATELERVRIILNKFKLEFKDEQT